MKIRFTLLVMAAMLIQLTTTKAQNQLAPGLDIVGYGYNIFGKFADNESLKPYQLFRLGDDRVVPVGGRRYDVPQFVMLENIAKKEVTEIYGSNEREYSKNFGASVGLEIEAAVFGASVNTAIEKSWGGKERNFFHTIRDANRTWRIGIDRRANLRDLLEPDAKNDIDKMDPAELFDLYGTHFIASAYLGGRADYTTVTRITEKYNEQDIKVAVSAKYKVVSANVETNFSSKEKEIDSNTRIDLTVTGGNSEYAGNIKDYNMYKLWADGIRELPVLCDFEKGSLRPIWDLAGDPTRKAQLEAAFNELIKRYPIPEAIADLVAIKNEAFMVKSKSAGLYWDFSGFNEKAEKKGGKLKIWPKDNNSNSNQGFDRVFRIIPHEMEAGWVYIQPQHTNHVLDVTGGVTTPNAEIQLWDMGKTNIAQQFRMEPVDREPNTYYIKAKHSNLYLEVPKKEQGTIIIQNKFTGADNQKWVFEEFDPKNIAPPGQKYYGIFLAGSNKAWDFPGAYPAVTENNLQLWNASGDQIGDRSYLIAKEKDFFVIRPDHHNSFLLTGRKNTQLTTAQQKREDNQLFTFIYGGQPMAYHIIHKETGQAIGAEPNKLSANGCQVKLYNFNGSESQCWELRQQERRRPLHEGTYHIKVTHSNKYIDLAGNDQQSNKNGANVQIWDMDGGKDRIVKFIPTNHPQYYKIQFQNGGRLLDVGGAWSVKDMGITDQAKWQAWDKSGRKGGRPSHLKKNDEGANIQIWDGNNANNQQWRLAPLGNNGFAVINRHSNKAVDVSGGKINDNGASIHQWHYDSNNKAQQFKLIQAEDMKEYKAE
jgi:hypothetical protein